MNASWMACPFSYVFSSWDSKSTIGVTEVALLGARDTLASLGTFSTTFLHCYHNFLNTCLKLGETLTMTPRKHRTI